MTGPRRKSGAPNPAATLRRVEVPSPNFYTHGEAVEKAVHAAGLTERDQFAPLVALLRTLAAQMDAAGPDPSTRLTAAYLSALKDLQRAAAPALGGRRVSGVAARRALAELRSRQSS